MISTAADDILAPGAPRGPYPMGLMVVLATVGMLFAAFTAAILVRRTGTDWVAVSLPTAAWINSIALVVSSLAVESARRAMVRGHDSTQAWLGVAGVLGTVFLAGQGYVWSILASQGVFLPTNPHAAFFYMLSAVHGAHVIGGLGALAWVFVHAGRGRYTRARHAGITHAAIYWHFVGGLWLYLLVVLTIS